MQLNADWAGEIVAWLQERKVDVRPLCHDLGIDPRDLKFGRQIQVRHFAALLDFGAAAVRDDQFGLHRGAAFQIKKGGVLAYLAASAETVEEAIDGFQRYASVVCDGFSAQVKRDREGIQLLLNVADPVWRQCRHLGEFSAARMIGALRTITGTALSPRAVGFMYPRATAPMECRRFFRCGVEYAAVADTIGLSKEVLAIRIPTADSRLGHMLRSYADGLLRQVRAKPARSLEEKVLAAIAARLGSGRLSLNDVARDLGMSERTLRRRLREAGTSFSALVSRKRIDLAKDWLARTEFDLKHISFLLGYSEPAAFSRAFKRSTGHSPGGLRDR